MPTSRGRAGELGGGGRRAPVFASLTNCDSCRSHRTGGREGVDGSATDSHEVYAERAVWEFELRPSLAYTAR